ncbi:hypothetical protein [Azospirillum sp. sgz301742]
MNWYFSRALGMIGLLAGVVRVALALILDNTGAGAGAGAGAELMGAVGTGILFVVGGMLSGAVVDVVIRARKPARPREPGRSKPLRKQ